MLSPYEERDDLDESSGPPPSLADNLLPPLLGLIGIGALACGLWASGQAMRASDHDVEHCATVSADHARLACYDRLAIPHHPPMGALVPPLTSAPDGNQSGKP